jgi:outer membrane lipopolysaccharide assembly protein LptE/RlpB
MKRYGPDKNISRLILSLLIILSVGCGGYRLVETGSGAAGGANKIAIPVFKNNTPEPGIESNVTAKVREAFIQNGRLRVVREKKADLIFRGNVKHYELRPVSFDTNDNVTEYRVIMKIHVKVKDTSKNKFLIDGIFPSRWTYKVSSELLSSERARNEAIDEASSDFAKKMISIVVEGF